MKAPGQGDAYDWRGAHVVIKVAAPDTLGQLAVMESRYPPGLMTPRHLHEGEDEMFYVLDGRLQGFCEDEEWVAEPGSLVMVPRDRWHGFTVLGDCEARALVIVGPPRLDAQVAATGMRVTGQA